MNEIDLAGRVAVVTGGANGIGLAIARRLVASGAKVVLWDLDEASMDEAVADIGAAHGERVDICDEVNTSAAVEVVMEKFGAIDILVNSAGIAGQRLAVDEYPLDDWKKVLEVNLIGTFLCCKAVIPIMKRQNYGRIVNISSTGGKEGNPFVSPYGASKAGVISLTKCLGKELAETEIRVNAVSPAAIETKLLAGLSEERRRYSLSKIPMGRAGRPDEVAALVAWMCSEECSFSTGAVFDISGGRSTY